MAYASYVQLLSHRTQWPLFGIGFVARQNWHQNAFLLPRWLPYLYTLKKNKGSGVYLNIFQFGPLLATVSFLNKPSSFQTGLLASPLSPPAFVLHQKVKLSSKHVNGSRHFLHQNRLVVCHRSYKSKSVSFPGPQGPLRSGPCLPSYFITTSPAFSLHVVAHESRALAFL